MKLTDIPDYKNKKLRKSTWIAKGYIQLIDGKWWANTLTTKGYVFAPSDKNYPSWDYTDWNEYVEWKAEVKERLFELRQELQAEYNKTINELWKIERELDEHPS